MSVSDQIFLRSGLSPQQTAETIAAHLGLTVTDQLGRPLVSGPVPGGSGLSGGWVTDNYLGNEPDEPSIVDHYDVLWDIRVSERDEELVHAESLRLFALVTQRLPWPALLLRNLAWLVAVWSPTNGRHDFPEGVSPHKEHQQVWDPYVPTRW